MSNKTVMKKLTLNRETLASLDRAELGGVNGGTSPAISAISVASLRFCRYTPRVIQASVAVSKGIVWATQHGGGGNDTRRISRVGVHK